MKAGYATTSRAQFLREYDCDKSWREEIYAQFSKLARHNLIAPERT